MVTKRNKPRNSVFVDSSLALAAIGRSTPPHNKVFSEAIRERVPAFSVFLRKEFIYRLVDFAFELADTIIVKEDIHYSFMLVSQQFGARPGKNCMQLIACLSAIINDKKVLLEPRAFAIELYRTAEHLLEEYDELLKGPMHNTCECQVGGIDVIIDYRNPQFVRQQLSAATDAVKSCPAGRLVSKVFSTIDLQQKGVSRPIKTTIKKALKVCTPSSDFTCEDCKSVGDAVIVSELDPEDCGLACDKNLVALATLLNKQVEYVGSVTAAEKTRTTEPH